MTGSDERALTVGSAGQALTGRIEAAPPAAPAARAGKEVLPEGVLARVGPVMATVIGAVAAAAMAEAGFNLANFVLVILHLPLLLAVMFPLIMEAAAASFAIQDLRDRRQGHANPGMRVATYLTLVASAVINGVVGRALHGSAGLLEILAPLVLAALIHLHGDRANRAYHSRAVLRPEWRAQQLRAAQVESVMDVLPLLAGDDPDGRATVDLLRRRLTSQTLEPGEALIAAGWHQRGERDMAASRLRRLETVAATVWGHAGPSDPHPSQLRPTARPTGGATAVRTGGGDPSAPSGRMDQTRPATRPTGDQPARPAGWRRRTDEELLGELQRLIAQGRLSSLTADAIKDELHIHRTRAAALRDRLTQSSPPRLQVLPGQAGPAGHQVLGHIEGRAADA